MKGGERKMSKNSKGLFLIGLALAILSLLVLSVSCIESPFATDEEEDTPPTTEFLEGLDEDGPNAPSSLISQSASTTITAEYGGELLLTEFGSNTGLFVPANSLTSDCRISVLAKLWYNQGKYIITLDFSPDSLVFEAAAALRVDGKHFSSAGELNFFWYDQQLEKWAFQATGEIREGLAEFELDHFSKYAISN